MPEKFQRVEDNIYRGGEPSFKDLQIFKDVYGMKRIISLDVNVGKKIDPWVKQLKMQHLIISIDSGINHLTDSLIYLIKNISNLLSSVQPVYIHCLHGQDRTGLAIALFRVIHDSWSPEAATNEAKKFGFGNGLSSATTIFYIKLINSIKQGTSQIENKDMLSTNDSIVDNAREEADLINKPSGFNQNSFAPHNSQLVIQDPLDELQNRLDNRAEQWKFLPIVGEINNMGPLPGAGPVENSGALQFY